MHCSVEKLSNVTGVQELAISAHDLADPASVRPKFAIIIIAIQIEFLFPVHHLHGFYKAAKFH